MTDTDVLAAWMEWMDAHAEYMAAQTADASNAANAKMGRAWKVLKAAWAERRGAVQPP